MNAVDWIIVSVIGLSMLLSVLRGFTREALSLAAWVLALVGARVLTPAMSAVYIDTIEDSELRELAAFVTLFVAILAVGMLVSHLLGEAVRRSALSPADRVLGMAFGAARGILLVVVAVAFGAHWLAAEPWWQESRFIPPLSLLGDWTRQMAYTLAGQFGS